MAPEWFAPEERAELERCYTVSSARQPDLKVSTLVLYFARGTRMLFVDVEIPGDEELAQCFERALLRFSAPRLGPTPNSVTFGMGGFLLQLGEAPFPEPAGDLAHHRARSQRMAKEALESGAILPSDPPAQELAGETGDPGQP